MAQAAVGRPFGEFDFADEFGLYPGYAAAFAAGRRILVRRLVDLAFFEFRGNLLQGLRREAGANSPGVLQLAIVIVSEQQRAETDAQPFRFRVPADDELLLFEAFYF